MRIRLKKGVALFGTIAGAAIATALIVYNVNTGNGLNATDMDESGLFYELGHGEDDQAVVADAHSGDAAAAAGVVGDPFGDDSRKTGAADSENKNEDDKKASVDDARVTDTQSSGGSAAASETGDVSERNAAVDTGGLSSEQDAVQSYTEVVPQTRTETVREESVVSVDSPVTVTEQVYEEVDADPVDFAYNAGGAAEGELTTSRRQQEAEAAKAAGWARLEEYAKENGNSDWHVPDIDGVDMESGHYTDSFVSFN